ncbi:MAG: hypothetical protein JRI22_12715 [Deltaproteobacteria bacterium]|nr:hypothetical protein [Deltaproteobacteria bacterium]
MIFRKSLKAALIERAGSQKNAVTDLRTLYPKRRITETTVSLLINGWLIPGPDIVGILEDYTGKDRRKLFPDITLKRA